MVNYESMGAADYPALRWIPNMPEKEKVFPELGIQGERGLWFLFWEPVLPPLPSPSSSLRSPMIYSDSHSALVNSPTLAAPPPGVIQRPVRSPTRSRTLYIEGPYLLAWRQLPP